MKSILIFDDDTTRANRFFTSISAKSQDLSLTIQRTPQAFIDAYLVRPTKPDLISLHWSNFSDSSETSRTHGGIDVASFLAACNGACPVLIHPSDNLTALKMRKIPLDGGGIAIRFRTFGSDWIENHWFPYVRQTLSV